jgi:putative ABC transport system substrate-binding protein
MQRRQFMGLIGGAAALPFVAHAQQRRPVIGWLNIVSVQVFPPSYVAAFHDGLRETGLEPDRNLAIDYRSADNQFDRLPILATELVDRQVSVIAAFGSANIAQAARAATATIPIVFATGSDPVKVGLVANLNRPGGNTTGVSFFTSTLEAKRLEILHELVPHVTRIGFLTNPLNLKTVGEIRELETAAHGIGCEVVVLNASVEEEIDAAFARAAQQRIGSLLADGDTFLNTRREQITALAARYKIPTSYNTRGYVTVGGLMSYGDVRSDSYRQAGVYVGRILKGERPSELPVLQPSKFEFVINLKTARALGITFPASFYVRANEVIE